MSQERIQKKRPAPQKRATEERVEPKKDEEAEALKAETDALLDEIDGLLEETDVLVNYRQKGGQAVRVFLDTAARGFKSLFPRRNLRVL